MRRALLFFALLAIAPACKRRHEAPRKPRWATPAFHRIQSATATVFLLGSVHVGQKDMYPLAPKIEQAFARSDALIVEVRLDFAAKLEAVKLVSQATYPPGDGLHKHVDSKTWSLLAAHPQYRLLDRMKPWTAAITVLAGELQRNGLDPEQGLDKHFMDAAEARNMPIESIETVSEQLGVLSGLPHDLQVTMLRESLEEAQSLGPQLLSLTRAWKRGDEAALAKMVFSTYDKPEYAPLVENLFFKRNVKMVEAIEKRLGERGTFFVVVGAGHVVGNGGIVDLLRKKNVDVARVPL